jgi:peroxiredoxin
MQCRSHVAQLGRLYPDFQAAGAEVLVILGDAPERAARYASTLKVPFPVLSDAAFDVYHQFGLQRSYFVIQRTASAIVDRTGTIRYLRRATNPQTWLAESRELLGIVQGLGGA